MALLGVLSYGGIAVGEEPLRPQARQSTALLHCPCSLGFPVLLLSSSILASESLGHPGSPRSELAHLGCMRATSSFAYRSRGTPDWAIED
jgi:hypothetical protein